MRKILSIINDVFDGVLGDVPCHNSIDNWVRKGGLAVYKEKNDQECGHAMDESMMIGSQKMLLTVAFPCRHQGRPLTHGDIRIADITVRPSINSDIINETIQRVAQGQSAPEYIVTDNDTKLAKGIRASGHVHIRDISHTLGMLLSRAYKDDEDFRNFSKDVSDARLRDNMKVVAYLQPPSQRSIARFMNMWEWVRWSSMMLEAIHRLPAAERKAYGFITKHAAIIDELSTVLECTHEIELMFKQQGLSRHTVELGKQSVRRKLYSGNTRMINLGREIAKMLDEERAKLNSDEAINNSTDILESIFGRFKSTLSPNKLNGVTAQVLALPLYTKMAGDGVAQLDICRLVPAKRLIDVSNWRRDNLMSNAVSKRIHKIGKRYAVS